MKVGVHAQEDLASIIERKTKEIEEAGFALWGYGGGTCHPLNVVQPFAQEHAERGEPVYLCMQEMVSKHWAEPVRAEHYSTDGFNWLPIPDAISVRGSRYALAIKELRHEEFILPLNKTSVARGNSKGRLGSRYIAGRVDKACFELNDDIIVPPEPDARIVQINLVAELCDPYAVFLKN
jgi:hypothetical protein